MTSKFIRDHLKLTCDDLYIERLDQIFTQLLDRYVQASLTVMDAMKKKTLDSYAAQYSIMILFPGQFGIDCVNIGTRWLVDRFGEEDGDEENDDKKPILWTKGVESRIRTLVHDPYRTVKISKNYFNFVLIVIQHVLTLVTGNVPENSVVTTFASVPELYQGIVNL